MIRIKRLKGSAPDALRPFLSLQLFVPVFAPSASNFKSLNNAAHSAIADGTGFGDPEIPVIYRT